MIFQWRSNLIICINSQKSSYLQANSESFVHVDQLVHSGPLFSLGAFAKSFLVLIPQALQQLFKVISVGLEEELMETLVFLQDLDQSLLVLLSQLLFLIELLVQSVQL